jgi:hypothetical protein
MVKAQEFHSKKAGILQEKHRNFTVLLWKGNRTFTGKTQEFSVLTSIIHCGARRNKYDLSARR